jgi:GNAT superfamily N-acetyltransferase
MAATIRDAAPGDHAVWLALWQGYLDFYRTELVPGVTEATWARLMDPAAAMKMRVIERDGKVLGFAIHLPHASSWVPGDDCYLEDLFVAPEARGQGLGRALIEDLMALARARGWHRIWWMTEISNTDARKLYDSLAPCDDHIRYRKAL